MLHSAALHEIFENYQCVAGVDEAGRGALFGPVCAAAVVIGDGVHIDGLRDSKKLSDRQRRVAARDIVAQCAAYAVAFADNYEVDSLNILKASHLAMLRAIQKLKIVPDYTLVDGDRMTGLQLPHLCVVGGDRFVPPIMAASILAKVARDDLMMRYDKMYPQYQLARHKGYGTRLHYEMLDRYGATELHRKSFRLSGGYRAL